MKLFAVFLANLLKKKLAKGNHIQHYMNGRLVLDFVDGHPKALLDGVLALQLHAGAPMFAEFKDIRIKKLK